MNKLPLGTKVKVISAQAGAYGANGWVGTIVKNQNIQSGLDALDSEVTVKLEDETIWGIGMWDKIELEVVKPIYNKAQQKCIKKWNDAFEYRNVTKPDFARFIDEFNAIDPTPDPVKLYRFKMVGIDNVFYRNLTKENADQKLLNQVPGYKDMSKDNYELVAFTAGESLTVKSKHDGKQYTYIVEEES